MKKIFLFILSLCLFSISLNASPYPYHTKCPQWNLGDIVFYEGIQQNLTPSTALPLEFCWDAVAIYGGIYSNGSFFQAYEELKTKESTANWYASFKETVYGEEFWGTIFRVVVFGSAPSIPILTFNNTSGNLIFQQNIISPNGSTYNGKEFLFFVRHNLQRN